MSRFPFVRFDLPGWLGIDDGRYPIRAPVEDGESATDAVLVVRTFGAPRPPRRLRRRRKPVPADPGAPAVVPVTELTVIEAEPLAGDPAAWLEALGSDERDALVERALGRVVRAVAARRVAGADPALADPTFESAATVRIGYGDGDGLVEGAYEAAIELPQGPERRNRAAALRPQERMAALLGGRERPLACEELVLRARADLDAGRIREAALQLRVALEALLADRAALEPHPAGASAAPEAAQASEVAAAGQERDLAALEERRSLTGHAANEALRGRLSPERTAEVEQSVALCERVLRRRAARG